ncbi:MAG: hypothetical protein V4607_12745 [Pseudomonadota bacterium]
MGVTRKLWCAGSAALLVIMLAACSRSESPSASDLTTPKAACGPGSRPETGMQGRTTAEERASGRAAQGYTCNTELVGSFTVPNPDTPVAGYKVQRYVDKSGRECAYYDTTTLFPSNILNESLGVNVLDMSDPAHPVVTKRLQSLAMLSPHESLVVSQEAGVLAAVMGNLVLAPGFVDVYDISEDCRDPQLRSSALVGVFGHESGMAPDGKTFYSSSTGTPTLTAVDISNPSQTSTILVTPYQSHGLSISDDGNRAYLASGYGANTGLIILDVSDIQSRKPNPQVREVSRLNWPNRSIPQNAIPFSRNGKPYLLEIDEFSVGDIPDIPAINGPKVGAARIIDISDETKPAVISNIRLEVHEPKNRAIVANDPEANNIVGGYAGHYCNVPTRVNPDIAACTMILSGLRIFDIRDPHKPREVAYFNPPTVKSSGAVSSPSFVPERKEIWFTDPNSGFYVVKVTNGAW